MEDWRGMGTVLSTAASVTFSAVVLAATFPVLLVSVLGSIVNESEGRTVNVVGVVAVFGSFQRRQGISRFRLFYRVPVWQRRENME
jgi:protoporphyrinogen oxidase